MMKASEVYLRAAELVDERFSHTFTCLAIASVAESFADNCPLVKRYVETYSDFMWTLQIEILKATECDIEERQNLRVMLLCLMSAIAADDERTAGKAGAR